VPHSPDSIQGPSTLMASHELFSASPGAKKMPQFDGVLFAGDYTDRQYPPTLEAAVRSGVRAALKIAQ